MCDAMDIEQLGCAGVMKMVSLEAQVFLVEHVFHCQGEYTEDVKQTSVVMFSICHVPRHNITA
jgi:hypothetical protein